MKTILVDDMILDMKLFELKCADMPDFEIAGKFTSPAEALEYAKSNTVDFALLDIDMPGINGINLAKELRRARPDIIIVFVTAHPKFAVDAFKMKADYMVFKPFDRDDIADALERAKLLRNRQKKRVRFHTFGRFEMFADGRPVRFRSSKAKELLALCVYHEGRNVSIYEVINALWGEDGLASTENTGYRRTIKELTDMLKELGAEDIFVRERGCCRIRREIADCDYFDFLDGKTEMYYQFQGEFLSDYSWAEAAIYKMIEKKQSLTGYRHM
jgi:two-component SAPR family response regulator